MNSEALRKLAVMAGQQKVALVYTSQVRQKMDVMNPYMDPYTSSSGGMALSYYASTRVRLQKKSKLKEKGYGGVEKVVGVRTKARIDKSRLGPSNREC
jgi:RecA/RadA recombinase